ncbi:hypothetical protein [Aquimarina litoralis]|uniref:hypothetical protein n=1 Tax=Aquimarina litoralis TaxID=584605 RepID=UPI001C5849FE|nr:hypothetical protein [Aquimarina litoralis]MBW1296788.1 hypothetical protein [Aquimarina litoralis]
MKNLLKNSNFRTIGKNAQRSINGGTSRNACEQAISIDRTLCLCIGWIPQGNICVPGPAL